jgi:heme/copper-type cytochrome/quinol oxidase subunit 2
MLKASSIQAQALSTELQKSREQVPITIIITIIIIIITIIIVVMLMLFLSQLCFFLTFKRSWFVFRAYLYQRSP